MCRHDTPKWTDFKCEVCGILVSQEMTNDVGCHGCGGRSISPVSRFTTVVSPQFVRHALRTYHMAFRYAQNDG